MTVVPIRRFGDPVLRTPAQPVVEFDKQLRTLVADLEQTMAAAPGQGLAAPQIGVGLRVFTFNVHHSMSGHLINPVLHFPDDETQDGVEGGLSIPGLVFDCRRRATWWRTARTCGATPSPSRARPCSPVPAARDRPPGRVLFVDRLDTETRRAAMQAIRDADWNSPAPALKLSPHA